MAKLNGLIKKIQYLLNIQLLYKLLILKLFICLFIYVLLQ